MTLLFLIITRHIYVPIHRAPTRHATVDVLIPTFNEPAEVLRPTILGAVRIRGVHEVFVLDDGDRPEVEVLARHLGATYLARGTNRDAKAGNLNHALRFSRAEFVLTLDADHVPRPEILERTMGYFDDDRLAFVQTPQTFYNHDSFLFRRRRGGLWSEQGMFYDVIQPAKNRWNAAFYVGTSAVLRRSALDAVGGFATGTVTEDLHTSLRLHARGWKSLFVPEPLAFGLEAQSLREFYRQRRRWATGSLSLLLRIPDSPLRAKGLTRGQRINYLNACLAHLQGVQKLAYFVVPIACTFQLRSPVNAPLRGFVPLFLLFMAVSLFFTSRYARGTYHPIHTEAYNLANATAHLAGLRGAIAVERRFHVSSKHGRRTSGTWTKALLWGLLALSGLAIGRALDVIAMHGVHGLGADTGLIAASIPFLLVNAVHLLSFLSALHSYERAAPVPALVPLAA
jgi:cellulose synthase/poly-beta-1,6-N-acetylglucosamine synthase-like glycosyltransferase